jgi:peptidyl-prolyl cis-trans isomerase D
MAILEKLRVRAGLLLAIVIGLSLLAFVLGDFLNSGGSLFTRSKFEIAEVSGKSIAYTDYETKVKELEDIQKMQSGQEGLDEQTVDQIRNVTWENMIQDRLMEKQYDKLGLDVSDDELKDLIAGENPHPAIAQLFTDPQTGVFNRQAFNSFMQRIQNEPEESKEKTFYLYIENEIYRQHKYQKYLNLVKKGLYATSLETTRQQEESGKKVDGDYLVQNFNSISDSAIQVNESDLKKYYKENLNQYKQEESRDIRYVYFEVVPSNADFNTAKQWIDNIKPEFEKAEDVKQFVSLESDVPYDETNYNKGELPDTLNDFMFNAAKGATFGPYFENNAFKISRLAAINFRPDSVKARHILLRATQNTAQAVYKQADSLMTLIKKGADFATLAMLYSSDGSAQKGGDLGWFKEGAMVKPFSDSCFEGRKGDVKLVATQYGLHIIQILDQSALIKHVQVGTLVKNVVAGEATDHDYYIKANEFAGVNNNYEKFTKALETGKDQLKSAVALKLAPMEKKVNDLVQARQLVTWAYKAELHDVTSNVLKLGNKYVVATVEKIRTKGFAPLEEIRADIENKVKQEKKAEKISASIESKRNGAKTLDELAKNLGIQTQPVTEVRFNSSSLGNAGVEPNVIAAFCTLEKGKVSQPIVGENGVYVLAVNDVTLPAETEIKAMTEATRNNMIRGYGARTNYFALEALKELAKIKDNRREFY